MLINQNVKNITCPTEYLEYRLMNKFKISLNELYSMPNSKIRMFIHIMNIEEQFRERQIKNK